jgi:hypothetical protein
MVSTVMPSAGHSRRAASFVLHGQGCKDLQQVLTSHIANNHNVPADAEKPKLSSTLAGRYLRKHRVERGLSLGEPGVTISSKE